MQARYIPSILSCLSSLGHPSPAMGQAKNPRPAQSSCNEIPPGGLPRPFPHLFLSLILGGLQQPSSPQAAPIPELLRQTTCNENKNPKDIESWKGNATSQSLRLRSTLSPPAQQELPLGLRPGPALTDPSSEHTSRVLASAKTFSSLPTAANFLSFPSETPLPCADLRVPTLAPHPPPRGRETGEQQSCGNQQL